MNEEKEQEIQTEKDELIASVPEIFPVMPLRNTVLFPQMVIPIYIGRERSLRLIADLSENKRQIAVVAQKEGSVEIPTPDDLYTWGTLANVLKVFDMPDGSKSAIVQGVERIKIQSYIQEEPYFKATVLRATDKYVPSLEVDALTANIRKIYKDLVRLAPYLSEEHLAMLSNIQHPARLVDRAIASMNIPNAEKQEILEELDVKARLEKATVIINREIQRLELGEKIQSEVQDEISKTQREYYLREQMKAIKRELGEDEQSYELKELEKKIEAAGMPEETKQVALKELKRLEKIPPASPEYTVARTYLDWLIELPWSISTKDNIDIKKAKKILDEDHYGLEKVKTRILEYLAVRKLKKKVEGEGNIKGPILCFVGPPGVGKTSLGRSIARAMGRKFYRMSLGGVRDEAEIRGHRRTYIGALPGRIIQGMKKVGSNNPVFMLDEIDKLGTDFRGDPSSALLEVLDPEQNFSFSDHYLEVPFDLSRVMFIATANLVHPIPPALKDRMEILEFPGYIEEEKLNIARQFLIPKQLKEHGLKKNQIRFKDQAIIEIIQRYTREAGVRNLEREIANICRKVARRIVEEDLKSTVITPRSVHKYLGPPRFTFDVAERMKRPGVAIGLAWTPVGGDVLFVEATRMKGNGKIILTGQLGDVMKESATTAISYIRSRSAELGIEEDFAQSYDLHIHVPAGATPKDGPSAGITILTAVASLLTGKLVKDNYAMTGEITLRGSILPIGGVKEKVLAAHRAGIMHVILPEENKKDLIEIPQQVKREMRFHFVKDMDEVLKIAIRK